MSQNKQTLNIIAFLSLQFVKVGDCTRELEVLQIDIDKALRYKPFLPEFVHPKEKVGNFPLGILLFDPNEQPGQKIDVEVYAAKARKDGSMTMTKAFELAEILAIDRVVILCCQGGDVEVPRIDKASCCAAPSTPPQK